MTSPPLKTRYTILHPGPLRERDLLTLDWVDVEIETGERIEPMNPEAPEFLPTMRGITRVLSPLFNGRYFERVAVNSFKGPADMFVAEGSARDMPPNDAATAIYWTATIMRVIANKNPSLYERRLDAIQKAALAEAIIAMSEPEWAEYPRIHGPAVLFDGRIWW